MAKNTNNRAGLTVYTDTADDVDLLADSAASAANVSAKLGIWLPPGLRADRPAPGVDDRRFYVAVDEGVIYRDSGPAVSPAVPTWSYASKHLPTDIPRSVFGVTGSNSHAAGYGGTGYTNYLGDAHYSITGGWLSANSESWFVGYNGTAVYPRPWCIGLPWAPSARPVGSSVAGGNNESIFTRPRIVGDFQTWYASGGGNQGILVAAWQYGWQAYCRVNNTEIYRTPDVGDTMLVRLNYPVAF